ncbi:protein trichome birefringence-like 19 [Andrographis paniculata]|uniref:protein trichome birefringence-like 19 n=1 Tax=Andrographis paniculata TaxID=175694 RepID=UPI0021E6D7FC|nr:protein trichome birefringence-like 19 [Andrographis paniculata]
MKSELPTGRPTQSRRRPSRLAPLVALTILLAIPLYYVAFRDYSSEKVYATLHGLIETSGDVGENVDRTCTLGSNSCTNENENSDQNREPDKPEFDALEEMHDFEHGTTTKRENPEDEARRESKYNDSSNDKKEDTNIDTSEAKEPENDVNDSKIQKDRRRPVTTFKGNPDRLIVRSRLLEDDQCDIFTGEWVPDPNGPYYTNHTCNAIQEHQNCMKFGRPDLEFLKWRWKPDGCELPEFDPEHFFKSVKGKSIAFVGDSVARNHMQSLICLLSKVAYPEDLSDPIDQNRQYEYRKHDFNISMFWSPYLVRTERTAPDDEKRPFKLYLDEFDNHWTTKIALFDYVIISAGHWFFRPTYFHVNSRLVGCLYCPEPNISHLTAYFSYRRAFRTALRAVNDAAGYTGVTFLRTFAPSHFEGAAWDKGGDCRRTRPFRRGETAMEDYSGEMYLVQLEELRIAQKAGRRKRRKFVLFDATEAMQLRPDGHPSKYGRWLTADQTAPNDCVHWCLPGPIDSWSDFLQELLKREIQGRGR